MTIFNKVISQTAKVALSAGGLLVLSTSAVQAFNLGTYELNNHRDGGARNTYGYYGLRLDGLLNRNQNDTTVFDFEADGAQMFLNYDGTDVRIYGVAYNQEEDNFWDIDFLYQDVSIDRDGNGLIVYNPRNSIGDGEGTITSENESYYFDLVDFSGNHNYTFRIDTDHRGNPDYSGFGWVNHGQTEEELARHLYHSDWLFEVGKKVPEPTSLLSILTIGVLVTSSVRKRS